MKLATEKQMNGMAGGTVFKIALSEIMTEYKPEFLIETGTFFGTGTTAAILEGLHESGHPYSFYSIEVNKTHYDIARRNINDPNTVLLNGLSIDRAALPTIDEINFDGYPDDVFVDFDDAVRSRKYFEETNHDVKDNMLKVALQLCGFAPNFVLLDSAGHIGLQEFNTLMHYIESNRFLLALDDTRHVKHFRTVREIEKDARFKLLFETDDKFGSAVYEFNA